MKYRTEIDGLRAVAVIPVIFFHAGIELFSGGFVGVDVFFVISGYLITTILIDDIEKNRFSMTNFYERRARRILPALFFVMLCCITFAWMWMSPSQMEGFAKSLIAVNLFVSNIFFYQKSGYFDSASEEKPLLHTWSLAVEEQYYVFFPIFLFLVWRFGKDKVFWTIVVLAAISFVWSDWASRTNQSANFYLAHTRAWELFAGSISAFIVQKRGVRANNVLSIIGFAAILFAIFVYDEHTRFPSVYALPPILGVVALILFADKTTLVARLLSTKAMVGIGLISYSAYLWHQPLFAFARISGADQLQPHIFLLLSVFSLLLAWFSWRWVEKPFRDKDFTSRRFIFNASILVAFCLIVFGAVVDIQEGNMGRFSESELAFLEPRKGDSSGCHNKLEYTEIIDGENCFVASNENVTRKIAVIGDSHASAITDALSDALAELGAGFYTFNGSWCVPLMNFATNVVRKNGCVNEINAAYGQILANQDIETLILVAEWANYHHGHRYDDKNVAPYLFSADGGFKWDEASLENNLIELEKAISHTFSRLQESGKEVILVLPIPEYEFKVPNVLNPKAPFQTGEQLRLDMDSYRQRNAGVRKLLIDNAVARGFSWVDPVSVFCNESSCAPFGDEGSYYTDDNHLGYLGASMLVPGIVEAIKAE